MRNQLGDKWRILVFTLFLIVGVAMAVFVDLPTLEDLRRWTVHYGAWSVVLFALLYITVTQFPIPRTALTVSSGVLFGPALGIIIALIGTTVAALLSLTMLRALLDVHSEPTSGQSSPLTRWAQSQGNHRSLQRINARLQHRGWFSVMCLRLIPGLPFSILNYACVFTPVKRRDFTIATLIGSAPSTIIGVLLGDSLTTGHHEGTLVLLAALGGIGVIGLVIDILLPVKANG